MNTKIGNDIEVKRFKISFGSFHGYAKTSVLDFDILIGLSYFASSFGTFEP